MTFPTFLTFLRAFDSNGVYLDPQLLVNGYSSPTQGTQGARIFIDNARLLFIALYVLYLFQVEQTPCVSHR